MIETFLDKLQQWIFQRSNDTPSSLRFFEDLKEEEYDSDALFEDVPVSTKNDEDSNIAQISSNRDLYALVRQYTNYHKGET